MKVTDLLFSFDKGLYKMLMMKKLQVIKRDQDYLGVVDGGEARASQSLLRSAPQFATQPFADSPHLERTCFTPEEFTEQIMKAQRYQAIVLDEARAALNSRQSMTKVSRALTSMLAEVRQKNLFLFVVLPSIYDLDKYVALWRTKSLFHLYLEDESRVSSKFGRANKSKTSSIMERRLFRTENRAASSLVASASTEFCPKRNT